MEAMQIGQIGGDGLENERKAGWRCFPAPTPEWYRANHRAPWVAGQVADETFSSRAQAAVGERMG